MLHPLASDGTGDQEPSPLGLHYRDRMMDMLMQAKVANKTVLISYESSANSSDFCRIHAVGIK